MEIEKEALNKILNSNNDFKRLYNEHSELKLKIEISQRSEGVGTPDLESLQGISFPNDFS